jgi:hypothetical protein
MDMALEGRGSVLRLSLSPRTGRSNPSRVDERGSVSPVASAGRRGAIRVSCVIFQLLGGRQKLAPQELAPGGP